MAQLPKVLAVFLRWSQFETGPPDVISEKVATYWQNTVTNTEAPSLDLQDEAMSCARVALLLTSNTPEI